MQKRKRKDPKTTTIKQMKKLLGTESPLTTAQQLKYAYGIETKKTKVV